MASATLAQARVKSIAVDANPVVRPVQTGTERFAREVARRLPAAAPELGFTFYAAQPGELLGIDLTVLPGRRMWSQGRLPRELWRRRPDLFFAPAHVVPFGVPGRTLTVIHDLAFERFPDTYGRRTLVYQRIATRWAERRCPRLLTVSEATARDLSELHGVPPERITVVPLGGGEAPSSGPSAADVQGRLAALGVERPFALHVGRVEPRKNQLAALRAAERAGLAFVSAGPVVDQAMAAALRASPRCRVLGRISEADLEALYASAEALVFPSLYEGFGLPVLEAMRRGLPVVTARVASLPEVGGEAALYVDDPTDVEALATAVEQALAGRERLRSLGLARAATFTWDRTAAAVAGVIREMVD